MSRTARGVMIVLLSGLLVAATTTWAGAAQADSSPVTYTAQLRKYQNGYGKCLDEDTTRAGHVQLWHCSGGSEQKWTTTSQYSPTPDGLPIIFMFENQRTHDCLVGAVNGIVGQPVRAVPGPCNVGNAAERWDLLYANNEGLGWHQVLKNDFTGNCLELRGNNTNDGAVVQDGTCNTSLITQQWSIFS